MSKLIAKVLVKQLDDHLKLNNLSETYQSAYRLGHSTETALRISNDILQAIDAVKVACLVLLDLSAAFERIEHQMLYFTT